MSKDRAEVLMEEVREQFKIMKEGFDSFHNVPMRLDSIDGRLENIELDIKGVIRENSADITELKAKSA